MHIAAVISEFDPFHNGHKYLLDSLREHGVTHIVSIMSGNFTQRGMPAIVNKYSRTLQALSSGVDLVIEIPVSQCVAPAEKYAFAGVFLANSLGCVNTLGFATESGNIEELKNICDITLTSEFKENLKKHLKNGLTLAKSFSLSCKSIKDDTLHYILDSPNNILAIEYIKAIKKLNSNIIPYTIKRVQVNHNSQAPGQNIASASYIRTLIREKKPFNSYVPDEVCTLLSKELENLKCPSDIHLIERAILAKLRTMSPQDLSNISDVTEGLENRIYSAIKSSISLNDLYDKIKSKRYTLSRIKRIVLCSFLGITKDFSNQQIPYIRVLGTNKKGLEILKIIKNTAGLPIVTKFSEIKELNNSAKKAFELECAASDLYSLMIPVPNSCGIEQIHSMIKYNI